jgi:hypothetical protein
MMMIIFRLIHIVALILVLLGVVSSSFLSATRAFPRPAVQHQVKTSTTAKRHRLFFSSSSFALAAAAKVTEKEASIGINKVVAALRKDATAKAELGNLEKVTILFC